jgi:CMP-N-acetylneuraminic acid synthetase
MKAQSMYKRKNFQVSAFMPMKMTNERFPNKNIVNFNEVPLYNHILKTITKIDAINSIDIFSSDDSFQKFLQVFDTRIKHLKRNASLDLPSTSISQVISSYCEIVDSDIIVLFHATSPMLSEQTILRCLLAVLSGDYDSAATVIAMRGFSYFDGRPINFNLNEPLPRLQDIKPIIVEQNGLWVFSRSEYLKSQHRIHGRPFLCEISGIEAVDIDYQSDLDYLQFLWDKNFRK